MGSEDNTIIDWAKLDFSSSNKSTSNNGEQKTNTNNFNVKLKQWEKVDYHFPSLSLLKKYSPDEIFMDKDRVKNLGDHLKVVLEGFGIDATIVDVTVNSLAITFLLELGRGVNLKNILGLRTDFELHLASEIEINAENDKNAVEIVVKNRKRPLVGLRDIIESQAFQQSESPLTIAAGVDIQGNPLCIDLIAAPHMLIAGTTGSGKSVFIDDIILSIIYKASPADVRLMLIDPKRVELNPYNGIPHLINSVIFNSADSLDSFMWIEDEMLKRYDVFSQWGVKDIEGYNNRVKETDGEKIPRILIVIDEFADLMLESPQEMNQLVDRIARLGRAAGIHLVLATQLPISRIVTPQIKTNLPCRASFTVIDGRESKIILDKTGAERLLGSGDMIFSKTEKSGNVHAQAAYVSDSELWNVIDYVKHN